MITLFRHSLLTLSVLASLAIALPAEELALKNPGFEDQMAGWISLEAELPQPMSTIIAEAAHEGSFGLHVEDTDTAKGASFASERLPAEPGKTYRLTFFARASGKGKGAVYLRFLDENKKIINPNALPSANIDKAGAWETFTVEAAAPENTSSLAVWIHTFSGATGTIDFDDFLVESVDGAAITAPAAMAAPVEPVTVKAPKTASTPTKREKPAMIVIKVDDLKTDKSGKAPTAWPRVVEIFKKRHIKGSIGIICESLEGDNKAGYIQWLQDTQATGLVEFWFHGYDHGVRTENGISLAEFSKRPFEEQKERFEKSIRLMKEKTGVTLSTFGPPGGGTEGGFDEQTFRVMAEVPEMKTWLYPQPMDDPGRALQAAGKVTVLDRLWAANIEQPLFVPNSAKLAEAYKKNPGREYFVLQGHPAHWKEEGWVEFGKLLDFLTQEGAIFVTPTECAEAIAKENGAHELGAR